MWADLRLRHGSGSRKEGVFEAACMVHGFEGEAKGGALLLFEATLAKVYCDEVLDIPIYE